MPWLLPNTRCFRMPVLRLVNPVEHIADRSHRAQRVGDTVPRECPAAGLAVILIEHHGYVTVRSGRSSAQPAAHFEARYVRKQPVGKAPDAACELRLRRIGTDRDCPQTGHRTGHGGLQFGPQRGQQDGSGFGRLPSSMLIASGDHGLKVSPFCDANRSILRDTMASRQRHQSVIGP